MSALSQEPGRLRRRLDLRTIRGKLLALFALVIGAISLFVFAYFPSVIRSWAEDGLREKSVALGKLAAGSLESAVVFDDREAMQATLARFSRAEDVVRAAVIVDGNVKALWIRSTDPASSTNLVVPADSELMISETRIRFQGNDLGVLRLSLSLHALRASVARARLSVALVSLLIFVLGGLAVVFISSLVTGPLRRILKTADLIASGEVTERAPIETADEVGRLAVSFNRMVDRLETAHGEVEASYDQLTQIMDHLPAEVALFDRDYRYQYVNPAGISDQAQRDWVMGKTTVEYCRRRGVDPSYGTETERHMDDCVAARRTIRFDQTVILPDGQKRHFIRLLVPMASSGGEINQILGYGVDITERVLAKETLRATEERLVQAQRMESIGQLAGGVAHDFNNLLTAITGHSELLLVDLPEDSQLREDAIEIRDAADRAASLTKQLLAFSRKQVLQLQVLDVNDRIRAIETILRSLMGEHIELDMKLGATEPVEADPAQFEQAILNLAVNAHDAMPTGGRLTIATETVVVSDDPDLTSGRYTRLVVSDTGIGMDEETRERIFEPFFTTKDVDKGTGLGLSTVYGILKQSSGSVRCYSEVGVGTTFKLYLPSTKNRQSVQVDEEPERETMSGMETVLVTEDQENVRRLAVTVLSRLGYTVLTADGPVEALNIAGAYEGRIDLLLTDVVMPGMNGPEVAEQVTAVRPDIAVIYMSGYTDDILDRHGVKVTKTNYLEKPFTPLVLSEVVRRCLDTQAAAVTKTATATTT